MYLQSYYIYLNQKVGVFEEKQRVWEWQGIKMADSQIDTCQTQPLICDSSESNDASERSLESSGASDISEIQRAGMHMIIIWYTHM